MSFAYSAAEVHEALDQVSAAGFWYAAEGGSEFFLSVVWLLGTGAVLTGFWCVVVFLLCKNLSTGLRALVAVLFAVTAGGCGVVADNVYMRNVAPELKPAAWVVLEADAFLRTGTASRPQVVRVADVLEARERLRAAAANEDQSRRSLEIFAASSSRSSGS